jgi:hypothetical protein
MEAGPLHCIEGEAAKKKPTSRVRQERNSFCENKHNFILETLSAQPAVRLMD